MGRGSKNLSKGNRKLALMHESESLHYRMYKAGRTWLFAGIATFSLGAVLLGSQVTASAAEDPTQTTAPATTSETGTGAGQAADTNAGAGQAADSNTGATAEQPAAPTTTKVAADTPATNGTQDQAAANAGDITKPVTTTSDTTEAPKLNTDSNDFEGKASAPDGNTDKAETAGAVIKTGIFGSGITTAADNSTTANLGTKEAAKDNVDSANQNQNRAANKYTNAQDPNKTSAIPASKNGAIDSGATPEQVLAGGLTMTPGAGGQTLSDTQNPTAKNNDDMDQTIQSNVVDQIDDAAKQKDPNHMDYSNSILDQANDQGAISSDSGITDKSTNQSGLVTRNGTLYAQGNSSGLGDVTIGGSSQQGVNFGIPSNLQGQDVNLKVGTFKVVAQSDVGVVLQTETGERFQITNADLGKDSTVTTDGGGILGFGGATLDGVQPIYAAIAPNNSTIRYTYTDENGVHDVDSKYYKDLFKPGNTISGLGIYMANMNGGVIQQLTGFVTNAVTDISTLAGNIGTKLIGNGQSLINSKGLNIASVTQALNDLFSSAQELSNVSGEGTTAIDNYSGPGVSSIVATLVQILGAVGVDTEPFSEAYQASMSLINANIKEMNRYGDALMATTADDGTKGVNEEMLMPATIGDDGKGNQVISMKTPAGFSTWNAILNMVNSYITGWTAGIGKALDGVFTGEQPIDAPVSPTYVTVKDKDGNEIQYDVSKINGQKPQDILKINYDDSGLGRTPMIGSGGWDIVTGILDALSAVNNKLIQPAISAVSSTLTNGIGNIGSDVISGNLGAMKAEAAIPISWTDPSFIKKADDGAVDKTQSAIPGQFIAETFDSNMNLFNQTQSGSTTIAYQNVDKTQLRDLLSKVAPADQGTAQYKFANDAAQNPNASQYDVDRAVLALAPDAKITTGTSTTTDAVVGNASLKDLTNQTGQDLTDAATALQDAKDYLATQFTTQANVLTITPSDPSSTDATALNNVKVTFEASDFEVVAAPTDASDKTNSHFSYSLTKAGQDKLAAAVAAAVKDATVIPAGPSTITLTPEGQVTILVVPGNDATPSVALTDPKDAKGNVITVPVSITGKAGDPVDLTKLPASVVADGFNWTRPTSTTEKIPEKASNNPIVIPYVKGSAVGTGTEGGEPQAGDVKYFVVPVDEAGNQLADPISHSDGTTGAAISTDGLKAQYQDVNGKTWYEPLNLTSYVVGKDGETTQVLYTDKDPQNQSGNGGNVDNPTGKVSIVYVGDGLWKVDDGNGHSFTFDPSKFGNGSNQPIIINIGGNTNTNTNNNGGSGSTGTGSTGEGSTGTTGTGSNGTSLIILPGQNGDQGIKANKNPDGSITFVFPNGDTQTVQPGDNGDHTNPAGGNFKVNSDGTITFTDPSGNSFTVDPNNKGTGSTQPGSIVTNITLPGKDGEDGQNTPDQTFFVEKTPEGNVILHLPGGGTATLAPGETINLPGGGSAVLNPDGTITFTDPNGGTYTINPDNGNKTPNGQININPGNGSSLPSINGDGNIIIINPGDGTVNYGTGGNGEGTNNPNGGSTSTTTTTINIPGGDGIKATKNPDGSITFVFPNGDTQTVQPGGSTTPNKDGSFTVNPDGTITFTDPNGNSYTFDPNKGGQATQPIVINIPTPDGGASATKNPDGSFTFNFPGGGSETVQPGGSTKPASDGSYFTVNPDGTITFNDGKGGTFVLDPNSGKGATTEPGSKETVVIIPGKDGQSYVVDVEKTPEGNTIIHLPNGSTIPVKPGDTGTLPDGTKYVVNDNGTVTFTTPGGDTQTIDPNKGTGNVTITTNTTNNGGGTGNTNNTSNGGVDTDGDGLPDSTETVLGINPENKDTDGDGDTDLQELLNSTDPKDPNSNLNSLENGGKGGNTGNGGSTTTTTITTISNVPGQGGDVKVIKNPDGSITFVFPNSDTQTVQPGGSTTPDANGGSFTVNPDGTITFNDGKGGQYTIDPNKGGAATQPIVINIPTPDGGASATKNPDGSFTFNFPGGGSETVQPGGSTKPASDGSFFTVNPDGTITFNDGKGGTFILDPNSGKGNTTEPGSKETVVILPGKDGQNYVVDVEKTPEGNTIIHLPNGSTIPVKPGDTGTLPDGTKYVVNDNGSVTFTTPNGGTQTIDPNKGTSNITSTTTNTTNNNGGGEGTGSNNTNSNNTNSGNITYNYYGEGANGPASAQITLPAGKDGKSYTITYTKNPDGTFSITMPGGNPTDVKPGDKGSLPNGGSYVVLPDGSLSITNPDGSTTVVNPGNGNGNGAPLNGGAGNVTVNVTVNGGAGGATVNTPAGNYTVSVNGDGTYTITAPNGETVPNLKPGATGTLPGNGGSYEVGNGQITITEPGGAKLTFNVNTNGGNTNPGGDTNTNPGGTTDPNGNGGTGTTTPGGNGSTPTGPNTTTPTGDAGTAVTTPSNGNTGNTGNGGTGISTTTGEGTATGANGNGANGTGADQGGIVTGGDAGTATGTQAGTANQGGAIAQGTSAGTATTAAGAAASGEVNGNKQAADKSALPQTDEKPAEGIAALGLLGGLVSLLGLAGAKRRRKDI
ncbi:hypothetical protein IWT140_02055 [Secundilactobacillus pentosiphilus]|uniref:Gram-positive cocci surface proteins LPxTG domain-containing protein n=1 Tax=Secundilactobacillus pentosiphilus TaxID=1714682 RepID=A0A1Z5IRN2_9LACO|nr:KxYKxGKxW signal peptide domain-containing protein [Secundilactobacillus pentosiphilus]GAX04417.1 hypothetical protein IWT140_02055 [Secundilactobacillus pentosiphilus]